MMGNDGRGEGGGIKEATNDGIQSILRSDRRQSLGCIKEGQDDGTNPSLFLEPWATVLLPYQANLPSAGANSAIQNFSGVRLLGLPFDCGDLDICKFFVGPDIVDCLLVHKNGCFTDEAFVVFPSAMQAEFALHRNRQNMGKRYVEVFRCKKQEYYSSIAAEENVHTAYRLDGKALYFSTAGVAKTAMCKDKMTIGTSCSHQPQRRPAGQNHDSRARQ
uniref:RRM domain-containing protein n=1 Tax=Oryza barthii TaxID=65489 RepID=A0A0D3FCI0_9ORYZ